MFSNDVEEKDNGHVKVPMYWFMKGPQSELDDRIDQ